MLYVTCINCLGAGEQQEQYLNETTKEVTAKSETVTEREAMREIQRYIIII